MRAANRQPVRGERGFVLYWMIAARRASWNHALDRAIGWARTLRKPLVVLEALRVDYPWASDRLHRFVLDGMADNREAFADGPVLYYPYVEPSPGAGRGLLAALARSACVVVTDEFPCFFLPRMVAAAAAQVDVRLEAVDGNGLLPLAAADRAFTAASHFRRFVQRELPAHLGAAPEARPLGKLKLPALGQIPRTIAERWPAAGDALLSGSADGLAALPIDHDVPPVPMRGGHTAAARRLRAFVARGLTRYADMHDHPDEAATSRLSPYLHFGHVGAHEILAAVARRERWSPGRLRGKRPSGAREGWWGMRPGAEAFLDQLVVWRELAYNTAARRPADFDRFDALPAWALATLAAHAGDRRPHRYVPDGWKALEDARTHDALWNAAQRQLRRDGWFHNYLRMLWGKKILEWSSSPQRALAAMVHLMNRWSLDGRNPNSYAGYFWTLGRYDRPWPERPIFGSVRSMSSQRTRRKVRVEHYLQLYGGEQETR